MFLSSLFGLRQRINPTVVNYIRSLQRSDYGYGQSALLGSDLESVRHAVLSYQHMGVSIPNSANVGNFIKSLYNERTKLFSNRLGETGDLKSTALAFQTLEYLGELQRAWVPPIIAEMKTYLQQHLARGTSEMYFYFAEEDLSPLSANYYGIVLGSYVGFDFGQSVQLEKWASFVVNNQDIETGAFFGDVDRDTISLESTAHAVSSLRLLQPKGQTFMMDAIDGEALYEYASSVTRDIQSASHAHLAVALSGQFHRNFNITTDYDVLGGTPEQLEHVVQGTQLKPTLSVTSFDFVSHAGLDVEVSLQSDRLGTLGKTKLQWKDSQKYSSDEFFETADVTGAARFEFALHCYIVGVGEISLSHVDPTNVGFGMEIDASAHLENSPKEFYPDDTVPFGTHFEFEVTLYNQTHDEFLGGDFVVWLDVLDSSGHTLDSQEVDCRGNGEEIGFQYTLETRSMPAGKLKFIFNVGGHDGDAHTTQTLSYRISVPMVASNVVLTGHEPGDTIEYLLGETLEVFMEPATLPDLRTLRPLPTEDGEGTTVAGMRTFELEAGAPNSDVGLKAIGKLVSSGNEPSRYRFELLIGRRAGYLGTKQLKFVYVCEDGARIEMGTYDSQYEELLDTPISVGVKTHLEMVDVLRRPSSTDFHYGSVVHYRFRVRDSLTGVMVEPTQQATARMILTHQAEDGTQFQSVNMMASEAKHASGESYYDLKWTINPNAAQEPGKLKIVMGTLDFRGIDLYEEDSDDLVAFDITIGGHIRVDQKTLTLHENNKEKTALVSEFTLKCNDVALKDALLLASLYHDASASRVLGGLRVSSDGDGLYSVSTTLPHADLPSGNYSMVFFREVDMDRALEKADESLEMSAIEQGVAPIFVIPITHEGPPTSSLPVRPEVLVTVVLVAIYIFLSSRKASYVPKRKKVKRF